MREVIGRIGRLCAALLALVCLGLACSTAPKETASDTAPATVEAAMMPASPAPFLLAPGDELEVKFLYQPTFSDRQLIRPDGKIALPLVGAVLVAGKTPDELESELRGAYTSRLDNAELVIVVRELADRPIYLDGEVTRPQAMPMRMGLTVMQAIAGAGGATPQADLTGVMLMRCQPGRTLEVRELRLKTREDWIKNNVALQAFDIVYLPKTRIAQANQFVDQYLSRMMPDWIHVSFPLSYSLGGVNDGGGDTTTRNVIISGAGLPP